MPSAGQRQQSLCGKGRLGNRPKEEAVKGIRHYYRLTLWESIFVLLTLFGLYSVYLRRLQGWGSQTSLKEIFPWGLCAGLDVFCGMALAVGCFTVAATLYLLRIQAYRPILRISLVTGYLGFLVAVLATIANRPIRFWSLVSLWTPHWAVLGLGSAWVLYTVLLALEFYPEIWRESGPHVLSSIRPLILGLLAVSAATLSALHQSALTRLLIIAPDKFSSLWLTPMLPVLLYLSSLCAGLALVVFAAWHANRAIGKGLPPNLLSEIAQALGLLLSLYVSLRFVELLDTRVLPLLLENHLHNYLLAVELSLWLIPAFLLIREHGILSSQRLYNCAALVLAGFVTNRLNISITAREAVAGVFYVPQWIDVMIAYGVIAVGAGLFSLAVRYLPVLPNTAGAVTEQACSSYCPKQESSAAACSSVTDCRPKRHTVAQCE
jgi:Ni/Fe-hydrogenase subunit HybB-like protein